MSETLRNSGWDEWDGIDYDEIAAATQEGEDGGRVVLDSADYPTEEAFMAALMDHVDGIIDEVLRDLAAESGMVGAGQ